MKLDTCITYVLSANDTAQAKPYPEPVLKTLAHFGIRTEDALVVGDTVYDILMGTRAGVKTCGVTYGNGTRKQLLEAGADYIIDSFEELLEWL